MQMIDACSRFWSRSSPDSATHLGQLWMSTSCGIPRGPSGFRQDLTIGTEVWTYLIIPWPSASPFFAWPKNVPLVNFEPLNVKLWPRNLPSKPKNALSWHLSNILLPLTMGETVNRFFVNCKHRLSTILSHKQMWFDYLSCTLATLQLNNIRVLSNVTRLGDLLDFGQLFKAFGNNWFAQISHMSRQFL